MTNKSIRNIIGQNYGTFCISIIFILGVPPENKIASTIITKTAGFD